MLDAFGMSDDRIEHEGERLHDELDHERQRAGGRHRWRCSAGLRARVLAYAAGCRGDDESQRRIAARLGLVQATLSRWIREAGHDAGFRSVAIIPSERKEAWRAAGAPAAPLRLLTPRGFIVEGLDAQLLASLLRVLG